MSGEDFDFGLSDIVQSEDSGRTMARGGVGFLVVVFFLLSSLTTFLFFSTYAAAVGSWAGPGAAPLVAGAVGVLCLDAAALIWSYVRSRAATSGAQMSIALVASVGDLLMALLTSALYILLSTSFETGIRNAAGALTEFGVWVNWIGVAVITCSLVGNFAAVFAWGIAGADTRKATQNTQLRATVAAGQFKVDHARAVMTINRTVEAIAAQLPAEADSMAARQSSQYVASTMRRGNGGAVDAAELARALEVIRAAGYGAAHVNGNGNGAGVAGGASFRGGNGD